MILTLLLGGSLLLSACDLGGSSNTPAAGGQTQPPPTAQQPAAGGATGGANGGVNFGDTGATITPGNSGGAATGNGGGSTTGSAGNTGTSNIAVSGALAAEIPVNGTDPSQQPIVQMVQKVGPAVVTVVNTLRPSFGGGGGQAEGSGAIIDQQGDIITNNHVVAQAQSLYVIFADGKKQQAQLVGADPNQDLAVIRVSGQMPAVIPIGNSDQLLPGEVVVAIGSALGEFQNTVTVGVVSGLHRSLDEGNGVTINNLIQTDAAINHGNSGGPLLNLAGELVGINTLGVTQAGQGDIAQGLGFSIPAKSVQLTLAQILRNPGQVTASNRPYLGVTVQPVTPQLASYYNLVDANGNVLTSGALITQVGSGTPAAQAGLQAGDVIVAVNNQPVSDQSALGDILTNFKAGDKITLTIIRSGRQGTANLTLGARPSNLP